MVRSYSCEALVLKRNRNGESDSYFTLLTRKSGLLRVIAKGIRKINSRRAPYLDLFNHVTVFLAKGRNVDIVTDLKPHKSFKLLKSDLTKVALTFKMAEVTVRLLPENEPHFEVFDRLITALVDLEKADAAKNQEITEDYCLFLLHNLGYLPGSSILKGRDLDIKLEEIMEKRIRTNSFLSKLV